MKVILPKLNMAKEVLYIHPNNFPVVVILTGKLTLVCQIAKLFSFAHITFLSNYFTNNLSPL
jgi:hypothetical protein